MMPSIDFGVSWGREIHDCSFAWISAKRMLSAILQRTDGDGLISSRCSLTATINQAAISIAALDFFSSFLLLASRLRS